MVRPRHPCRPHLCSDRSQQAPEDGRTSTNQRCKRRQEDRTGKETSHSRRDGIRELNGRLAICGCYGHVGNLVAGRRSCSCEGGEAKEKECAVFLLERPVLQNRDRGLTYDSSPRPGSRRWQLCFDEWLTY